MNRRIATENRRLVKACALMILVAATTFAVPGCEDETVYLIQMFTIFGDKYLNGCAKDVGFDSSIRVVGPSETIHDVYTMWNDLDGLGYKAPPLIKNGAMYRENNDGAQSYIDVDDDFTEYHVEEGGDATCDSLFFYGCGTDMAVACYRSNPLGGRGSRWILDSLEHYRDSFPIRDLGLAYVGGVYHHETMHHFGPHTANWCTDQDAYFVFGAGDRTSVKTAADVLDAAVHGKRREDLFTKAALAEFGVFYRYMVADLKKRTVDDVGIPDELAMLAPDYWTTAGSLTDYLDALGDTDPLACLPMATDAVAFEPIGGGHRCVTKHAVRFRDEKESGQPSTYKRIMIRGPYRVRLTPSELQNQADMNGFFTARDPIYSYGPDDCTDDACRETFDAAMQIDQASANFCSDGYNGPWQLLPEFDYDIDDDGTFRQDYATFLQDNMFAFPAGRERSFDAVSSQYPRRFGDDEPLLLNRERRGVVPGSYAGNVASALFLRFDQDKAQVLTFADEYGAPDYNYMLYEPDGAPVQPEGWLIDDHVHPMADAGIVLSTDRGQFMTRDHAARFFCYLPLFE
jgi:hypothetical protein